MASPRRRTLALVFMLLAVGFAVVATVVLSLFFSSLETRVVKQNLSRKQELVDVVVAARSVPQGATLTEEHLEIVTVPRMFFLDTMVSEPDAVIGLVLQERALEGEPVRRERLAPPESGTGLNALIPEGQRALQMDISGASGVAGFITPGDYVDILFTGQVQKSAQRGLESLTPGLRTTTLLQSKRVLAIDNLLSANEGTDGQTSPSITLALMPAEAQLVTHAMQTGSITFTLRNHIDATKQDTNQVSADTFIGAKHQRRTMAELAKPSPAPTTRGKARPQTAPSPTAPDIHQTTIIEGGSVRTVEEQSDD
ncbi:MAG: Flp pilus assembly protein CpaB [Deltaproteobacteria bacterium]|nr:MAG: Flp pilus assembly protein CpaB [Deltaproteobacteria bacterium]